MTATGVAKSMLTTKYRGGPHGKARRGTIVRVPFPIIKAEGQPWQWTLAAGDYEVCDLFDRKSFTKDDEIGIVWRGGLATSVRLDQIEIVD